MGAHLEMLGWLFILCIVHFHPGTGFLGTSQGRKLKCPTGVEETTLLGSS